MKFFLMLSLASSFVSCFVVVNGLFGSKTEEGYPMYHVGIVLAEYNILPRVIDPYCAGVVIADKWIATHRFCIEEDSLDISEIISELVAVAGVTSLKNIKKHNIIHFEDIKINGDIALVKTKESLLSAGATIVSLPSVESWFSSGVISEFVGLRYGFGPGTLDQVEAVVVANKKCPKIKESTEFCVRNIEEWLDYVCPTTGGPFVVDNVLYGIRSGSCGDTQRYNHVFKYVQWIKEIIA